MKYRITILIMILGCVVILSSGCATVDPVTNRRIHNSYSIEEDVEIGKLCLEQNINQSISNDVPVNEDRIMLENLEMITERIASVSDLPDLPYSVTLFQSEVVNAAAAPGGAIMVYSGLYDPEEGLVETNEELAAVIAHEIAHVNCRHSTEQMTKGNTVSTFGSLLSAGVSIGASVLTGYSSVGDLGSDIVDAAYNIGAGLWFPSYSRKQEKEADALSLLYMAKARINPRAAIDIWKRAAEKSKDEETSIYASHPKDSDRVENMEKLLPEALRLFEEAGGDGAGKSN